MSFLSFFSLYNSNTNLFLLTYGILEHVFVILVFENSKSFLVLCESFDLQCKYKVKLDSFYTSSLLNQISLPET